MRIKKSDNLKIIMNSPSKENLKFKKELNVAFQRGVSSIPSVEPGYFRLRPCYARRTAYIGRYWERVGSYIHNATLNAK